MATFNSEYQDELPVIQLAERENKGVLIKKGLMSGHVIGQAGVEQSFKDVFAHDGVSSVVVGTINPHHLRSNIESLIKVLG
jgi:aryl-alcohol dehydrogenase-like predicted oxidoreductase